MANMEIQIQIQTAVQGLASKWERLSVHCNGQTDALIDVDSIAAWLFENNWLSWQIKWQNPNNITNTGASCFVYIDVSASPHSYLIFVTDARTMSV